MYGRNINLKKRRRQVQMEWQLRHGIPAHICTETDKRIGTKDTGYIEVSKTVEHKIKGGGSWFDKLVRKIDKAIFGRLEARKETPQEKKRRIRKMKKRLAMRRY